MLRPLVGTGTSCRSSGVVLGVQRPRRVLVSRRRRLYSNPGIRAVVIPVCPSCLGMGRPFAEHVERLRIDWGSVFSPRPTNRNWQFRGCSTVVGQMGRAREPECAGRKVAIGKRRRRALAESCPSFESTQGRDQYTKQMSPRRVACSSEFEIARTLRGSSQG